jgi:hypothetical protein
MGGTCVLLCVRGRKSRNGKIHNQADLHVFFVLQGNTDRFEFSLPESMLGELMTRKLQLASVAESPMSPKEKKKKGAKAVTPKPNPKPPIIAAALSPSSKSAPSTPAASIQTRATLLSPGIANMSMLSPTMLSPTGCSTPKSTKKVTSASKVKVVKIHPTELDMYAPQT